MRIWLYLSGWMFLSLSCQSEGETEWCLIEGGTAVFGSVQGMENEKPEVRVTLNDFYLSPTEVSNAEFEAFVSATDYKTDAEHSGSSMVFDGEQWKLVRGANWRHPEGPVSHINERKDFPVVQVSYNDALAYCEWKSVRLPSEVEFEYALSRVERPLAGMNITRRDKTAKVGQVRSAKPDSLGCYHMAGNVWEWCADVYNYEVHDKWLSNAVKSPVFAGKSFDPLKVSEETLRVIKGGSFLCQKGYCAGYLSFARQSCEQSAAYNHIGFRVAKDKQ